MKPIFVLLIALISSLLSVYSQKPIEIKCGEILPAGDYSLNIVMFLNKEKKACNSIMCRDYSYVIDSLNKFITTKRIYAHEANTAINYYTLPDSVDFYETCQSVRLKDPASGEPIPILKHGIYVFCRDSVVLRHIRSYEAVKRQTTNIYSVDSFRDLLLLLDNLPRSKPMVPEAPANPIARSASLGSFRVSSLFALWPTSSININNESRYIKGDLTGNGAGVSIDLLRVNLGNSNLKEFGISIGVDYLRNSFSITSDTIYTGYEQTDRDNDTYLRKIYATGISENISFDYLGLRGTLFRTFDLSPRINFNAKAGLKVIYITDARYCSEGGLVSYRGKYPGVNEELAEIAYLDFVDDVPTSRNESMLDIRRTNLDFFYGIEIEYSVLENVKLQSEFTYDHGIGTQAIRQSAKNYIITKTEGEYNSLLYAFDRPNFRHYEISVGVIYILPSE
jgi:hypothetical protein